MLDESKYSLHLAKDYSIDLKYKYCIQIVGIFWSWNIRKTQTQFLYAYCMIDAWN
jgi:hypothetical protein